MINYKKFCETLLTDGEWGFDEQKRMFERIGWEKKNEHEGFTIDFSDIPSADDKVDDEAEIFFKTMSDGGINDYIIADKVEEYLKSNGYKFNRFQNRKFTMKLVDYYLAFVKEE